MSFSSLWNGKTSRLHYVIMFFIFSMAILLAPPIAGWMVSSPKAPDPTQSATRALILTISIIVVSTPFLFVTRRRLRDIGLSGAWLILFPLTPLSILYTYATAPIFIEKASFVSVLFDPRFITDFGFGILLLVLPSGEYFHNSRIRALSIIDKITSCEGRVFRAPFFYSVVCGLSSFYIAYIIEESEKPILHFYQSKIEINNIIIVTIYSILNIFANIIMISATIRRLHDRNHRGFWIILFPYGMTAATALYFIVVNSLQNPAILAPSLPLAMILIEGSGCIILLAYLLMAPSLSRGNKYGPSPATPAPSPTLLAPIVSE